MKTPLVRIKYEYKGRINEIYSKLEYYNITGSIKDRVAKYIIESAMKRGELKKGMPIIEATSGNTGISLSALGAYYGHPVYIFMPDWVSEERIKIMKLYNAQVRLFSKEEGGFLKCIDEAEKLAKQKNGFLANQFANPDNVLAHYETTGMEIIEQVPEEIGAFISGIGTGGTLMGTSRRLKEKYNNIKTIAIEPDKMPMLSKKQNLGIHLIEGIGDEFIPEIVKKDEIDEIILVNDYDAINMSRKLSKVLGLGVGISSGANLIGAINVKENTMNAVVTVFADDNKKYLTTELAKPIDNNNEFVSNNVKLLDYEIVC